MKINKYVLTAIIVASFTAGVFFTALFNNSRRIETRIETAYELMEIHDNLAEGYDTEKTRENMFKDLVFIRSFLPNEGQVYDDVRGNTYLILPKDVPSDR